ncbi:MAG: hypothetical protein ACR2RE_14355 [Geminicoccaceae bacterium]
MSEIIVFDEGQINNLAHAEMLSELDDQGPMSVSAFGESSECVWA